MQVIINKSAGVRNDLLLVISRDELDTVGFHIINRDGFMKLPGLLRGSVDQDQAERRDVGALKRPIEDHFREMTEHGAGLVDASGTPTRRLIAVGSRNVGNNRGFQAWQRGCEPPRFLIRDDDPHLETMPMLTLTRGGAFVARDCRIDARAVLEGGRDVSDELEWCVFANCVMRRGRIIPIEEMADRFYDFGHVAAVPRNTPGGQQVWREVYEGQKLRPLDAIVAAMRRQGIPRNRYLHNAIGLSQERIVILQREGTIEEIASWLKEAGADDGFILDNGGSVFCWAWWVGTSGDYLFRAPDFRPASSAILAFVLHGAPYTNLPPGSVSYSVL